jgi:hypothetical protein
MRLRLSDALHRRISGDSFRTIASQSKMVSSKWVLCLRCDAYAGITQHLLKISDAKTPKFWSASEISETLIKQAAVVHDDV